jgi:hypothetical protein
LASDRQIESELAEQEQLKEEKHASTLKTVGAKCLMACRGLFASCFFVFPPFRVAREGCFGQQKRKMREQY